MKKQIEQHYLFFKTFIQGESGLHMAIVSEDIELMELFVEKGADINSRATGLFFLPEDQKEIIDPSITNYEGWHLKFCLAAVKFYNTFFGTHISSNFI